jgi:hypothetical protein
MANSNRTLAHARRPALECAARESAAPGSTSAAAGLLAVLEDGAAARTPSSEDWTNLSNRITDMKCRLHCALKSIEQVIDDISEDGARGMTVALSCIDSLDALETALMEEDLDAIFGRKGTAHLAPAALAGGVT